MPEANQCDIYCPRKALLSTEYREGSANVGPAARKMLAVKFGVRGVVQFARAASCPMRNEARETWRPQLDCDEAVNAASEHSIDEAALTDHERRVLGPYIGLGPPIFKD